MPRTYTSEQKIAAVKDWQSGGSGMQVARKHKISSSMLSKWRRQYEAGKLNGGNGKHAVAQQQQLPTTSTAAKGITQEQKALALARMSAGEDIKDVAQSIGVDKSNLYRWRKEAGSSKTDRFPLDVKIVAVRRMLAGESMKALSAELGVSDASLYMWKKKLAGMASDAGSVVLSQPRGGRARAMPSADEISDAIGLLRNAERDIAERWHAGSLKRPDQAHILTMLVLRMLDPMSR